MHLIYYDGECAFCNRTVHFVKTHDKHHRFAYKPLQALPGADLSTVILVEESGRQLLRGKAGLRILWHLGGWWRLLGALSFLPFFLTDPIYRLIAKHRHLF
jgi:predicted DCC family thiol-disulfide oxidoreductase YuxK